MTHSWPPAPQAASAQVPQLSTAWLPLASSRPVPARLLPNVPHWLLVPMMSCPQDLRPVSQIQFPMGPPTTHLCPHFLPVVTSSPILSHTQTFSK